MSEQDQQIGELIGTLKTFMESEKEARAKTDETISKLAATMTLSVDDLKDQIQEAKKISDSAHQKIKNIYKAASWVGGTITAMGAIIGWIFNHGSQAVEVGKEIINHK